MRRFLFLALYVYGVVPTDCGLAQAQVPDNTSRPASSCPIRIELRLPKTQIVLDRQAEAEVTIKNHSEQNVQLYNPSLNTLLMARQRPVALAIMKADGTYIGDLLTFHGVSTLAGPQKKDWVAVPPGKSITTTFRFRPGSVGASILGAPGGLSPGKYLLEFRAHEPFLSGPPAVFEETDDPEVAVRHETYRQWAKSFPGAEVCRSNRVELEILPRTGD